MEELERKAIETDPHKPKLWLRYVDYTYVIWTHDREHLNGFLDQLNSIHDKIKFTMEVETENQLPFLDALVKKKPDGHLAYAGYRKPIHMDRYLNAESHSHPAQLNSEIKTLITRSLQLADAKHIYEEMAILEKALLENVFSRHASQKFQRPFNQMQEESERPVANAYL